MINLCHKTEDDTKTKEELLENIIITCTTYDDADAIIEVLVNCFEVRDEMEAFKQLVFSRANLYNSVKAVDRRDGKIYGLLILSEFPIQEGSPIMHIPYTRILGEYISKFSQLNGHSFILDERLRGTSLDKKMLYYNYDFIKKFDFIWCGVEKDLKSHNYWKRLGFTDLFSIHEATFYIMKTDKKPMNDIFILKALSEKDEKDYIERRKREVTL